MALTNKQKMFIEEYLVSLNATDACRKAGYGSPNKQAYEVLTSPTVLAEIKKQIKARAKALQVTRGYVIERLIKVVDMCLETEGEGEDEEFKRPSQIKNGLFALEKLGKHIGMFDVVDSKDVEDPEINTIKNLDDKNI